MAYEFIEDLNGYFCEKYANYDKICVMEGYIMPKMQATKRLPDGRDFAYTLPQNTMRLSLQENKAEILEKLKATFFDSDFSFSFRTLGLFEKLRLNRRPNAFKKVFEECMRHKNLTLDDLLLYLDVDKKIMENIVKGNYYPTKNLIFSIAFVGHLSLDDTLALLESAGLELDYTKFRDVVFSYLLSKEIYNGEMVNTALNEYHVSNLFLKKE